MTALDKILDWKLGTNTNNNATGFLVTSDDFKDGQQELASLRSENERLKAENTELKEAVEFSAKRQIELHNQLAKLDKVIDALFDEDMELPEEPK